TTHLTGIVSDIGSAIGNFLAGRGLLKVQLALQTAIFVSFVGGAAIGAVSFRGLGDDAVFLNGVWVAMVGLAYIFLIRQKAE
ncbi:MAG: DUF1275 family protein, partial [Thalassolituus sp.]